MRNFACVLIGGVLLVLLAGCKSKLREMSEYPFFVKRLDQRWETVRESLKSPTGDVSMALTLTWDLKEAAEVLKRDYQGPNREQAISALEQIAAQYSQDLSTQVSMDEQPGVPEPNEADVVWLFPGIRPQDVRRTVEKHYEEYRKFRELVKL